MVRIRSILFPTLAVALLGAAVTAQPDTFLPPLRPETAEGWRQYAEATKQRIDRELTSSKGFLALDFTATASTDRPAILSGQMPIVKMQSTGAGGRAIDVPDAWVHHQRGAVLVPRVTLDRVFQRLQEAVPGIGKGDVVEARILARNGGRLRTFIKVQRTGSFLGYGYRFMFNTEHDVLFVRVSATRGTSTSTATKIAELEELGTAREREVRPEDAHRLMDRWNSYWRYEEVPAGVIVECESITLSRAGPFGLGRGMADTTARESMEKALVNVRGHFAPAGQARPR